MSPLERAAAPVPPLGQPRPIPTVMEEVVKGIRAMIMAGQYRSGERLIEESLAVHFGVSRPPIREALLTLQSDGIVLSIPRKGFIVVPITANDVREIYELRWILESSAIEKAMPITDPDALLPLAAAVDRMRGKQAQNDPDDMLAANSEFHTRLVELAGNSRLTQAYQTITAQLQMCMAMNLRFRREVYGDPGEAVRRHQVLVDMIRAGDAAAVVRELEDHGDQAFLEILDTLIGPQ